MSIKTFKPTTPSRRQMTVSGFDGIDKKAKPEPSLTEPLKKQLRPQQLWPHHRPSSRRRQQAQVSHHRLQARQDGYRATVLRLEYDPNRSANIALIEYEDGEKRYILAPVGLKAGDKIMTGPDADILPGNALPIANIPVGTVIHNIELHPGNGAQLVRCRRYRRSADGQGGRRRSDPYALRRGPHRAYQLLCHHRPGGQHRAREHQHRQGRP